MKIALQKEYFEINGNDVKLVCNIKGLSDEQMDKLACAFIRLIAKEIKPELSLPSRGSRQALLDRIKEAQNVL